MKTLARWLALAVTVVPAAAPAADPLPAERLPALYVNGVGPLSPLLLNESGDVVFEAMRLLTGEGELVSSQTAWTNFCTPADVNHRGAVVGECDASRAAYWSPGAPVERVLSEAISTSGARAVNALGEVVGYFYSYDDLGHYGAFYWSRAAGFVDVGLEGLEDINDRGLAVGRRQLWPGWVPVIWSREAGVRDLQVPEGFDRAWAQRVNNRGQVLGQAAANGPDGVPVFWDVDGSAWPLAMEGASETIAVDLNELGQVVGYGKSGREWWTGQAFLWSLGEGMRVLDLPPGDFAGCTAHDVNNYGEAVGICGGPGFSRAFLWQGGEVVELAPSTVDSTNTSPHKINDSGRVVGTSVELLGGDDFVWQPVSWQIPNHPQGPAPGSEVLLAPEFEPAGVQMGQEGKPLAFTVAASDPNDDPVTLRVEDLPDGAAFDAATGRFSWTPSSGQEGSYRVVFTAADDGEPPLTAEQELVLLVAPGETGDSGGTGCFVTAAEGPPAALILAAVPLLAALLQRPRR